MVLAHEIPIFPHVFARRVCRGKLEVVVPPRHAVKHVRAFRHVVRWMARGATTQFILGKPAVDESCSTIGLPCDRSWWPHFLIVCKHAEPNVLPTIHTRRVQNSMMGEDAVPNVPGHLHWLDCGLDILDYARELIVWYPVELLVVSAVDLLMGLRPRTRPADAGLTPIVQAFFQGG